MRKIAALIIMAFLLIAGALLSPSAPTPTPFQTMLLLLLEANSYRAISGYGTLYTWEPGSDLFREQLYRYNQPPVLAPNGMSAAYLNLPNDSFEAWQIGLDLMQGTGPRPANVWLLDLTRARGDLRRRVRVAVAARGNLTPRSQPVWSPDSARIAWLEQDVTAASLSGRLMIYDVATRTTRVAAQGLSLGLTGGATWTVPQLIGWGSHIAYISDAAGVYPGIGDGFGKVLNLIDEGGGVLSRPVSYFANFEDALTDARWLLHNGEWRIGLAYPNLGWVLFNPAGGSDELLQNPPFVRAVTGKGWTGDLLPSGAVQWRTPDGVVTPAPIPDTPFSFTPEGIPFSFSRDGEMFRYDQGDTPAARLPFFDVGIIVSFVWTPGTWQTDGIATPLQPSPQSGQKLSA